MFLTDRARQLRPAVDRAIAQCRQLFDEDAFELAQVERVLVLGANDYIQSTLGSGSRACCGSTRLACSS